MDEVAEDARTYVMAHAYNDGSVRNCLEAGVRSIEHGNLIDEETARLTSSTPSQTTERIPAVGQKISGLCVSLMRRLSP